MPVTLTPTPEKLATGSTNTADSSFDAQAALNAEADLSVSKEAATALEQPADRVPTTERDENGWTEEDRWFYDNPGMM